jgi:hypothetical protein
VSQAAARLVGAEWLASYGSSHHFRYNGGVK